MIGGTPPRGRITQTLLAFACVLCCAAPAPAIASASGTGSISGTVTEAAGAAGPIENTQVCAHEQGGEEATGCQTTDSSGNYSIEDLPEGEYIVEFSGCVVNGCSPEWAGQYYNDVFFAFVEGEQTSFEVKPTFVHVTEGVPMPGIDAGLYAPSRIEGTVKSASGPIADMPVCVDGIGLYYPACTVTNRAGAYSFVDVPPGEYVVEFTGEVCEAGTSECSSEACKEERISCTRPYIPQFYGGATSPTTAYENPWRIEPGESLKAANATLQPGGAIEGTVTVAALGAPGLGGIEVCARPESEGVLTECTKTRADGQYAIEGLASASYQVEFKGEECIEENGEENCHAIYRKQFFHDSPPEAELLVNVAAPKASTGIDASMVEKSPIQPVFLTAPQLSGIPNVSATLSCSGGTWSNSPTSIAYLWEKNGVAIPGQNSSTYTVAQADEGASLACHVTVKNVAGSTSATSDALSVGSSEEGAAPPKRPGFVTGPTLSGVPNIGAKLSCSAGTWVNHPTSISYTWVRNGIVIASQSGNTYTVTREDEGSSLTCDVTVTNTAGSASLSSNALIVPVYAAPKRGLASVVGNASAAGILPKNASLTLKCRGAGACKGSLRLVHLSKHGKAKALIGIASFAIAAGSRETITVKLTGEGAGYVAKSGKHGLKVKLTGSDVKPRTLLVKLQR